MQRKLKVKLLKCPGQDQNIRPNYKLVFVPSVARTAKKRAYKPAENEYRSKRNSAQVALLNEDLALEYGSIVSSLLYSQVARSSQFFHSAAELERHAAEEINHAGLIEGQIENLGGASLDLAKQVQTFASADGMFDFDQVLTIDRIAHYRRRIRQCEGTGEYAVVAIMRVLLVQEQVHQLAMVDALRLDHESHWGQGESRPALEPVTNLCCDDLRFLTTSYTVFDAMPNNKGNVVLGRTIHRPLIKVDRDDERKVGELSLKGSLKLQPSVRKLEVHPKNAISKPLRE